MVARCPALHADEHDIEIAVQTAVLKAIIEHGDVGALRARGARAAHAVGIYYDGDIRRPVTVQRRLVRCVTAVQNCGPRTAVAQHAPELLRERRLTGAADRDVADADDGNA